MLFFCIAALAVSYLVQREHYGDIELPLAIFGGFASAGAGLGCFAGKVRRGAALGVIIPLMLLLLGMLPVALLLVGLGVGLGAAMVTARKKSRSR